MHCFAFALFEYGASSGYARCESAGSERHCQFGESSVASAVVFSWLTGCANASTTLYSNYIPLIDPNHLYGEYIQDCPTDVNTIDVK